MFDYTSIRAQVIDSLESSSAVADALKEYDVDGIMERLQAMAPDAQSIDDPRIMDYWSIVQDCER